LVRVLDHVGGGPEGHDPVACLFETQQSIDRHLRKDLSGGIVERQPDRFDLVSGVPQFRHEPVDDEPAAAVDKRNHGRHESDLHPDACVCLACVCLSCVCLSCARLSWTGRAGTPVTTKPGPISAITTAPAPTTVRGPTDAPGRTVAPMPRSTSSPS